LIVIASANLHVGHKNYKMSQSIGDQLY